MFMMSSTMHYRWDKLQRIYDGDQGGDDDDDDPDVDNDDAGNDCDDFIKRLMILV